MPELPVDELLDDEELDALLLDEELELELLLLDEEEDEDDDVPVELELLEDDALELELPLLDEDDDEEELDADALDDATPEPLLLLAEPMSGSSTVATQPPSTNASNAMGRRMVASRLIERSSGRSRSSVKVRNPFGLGSRSVILRGHVDASLEARSGHRDRWGRARRLRRAASAAS